MSKGLLRSVIDFGDLSREDLILNFQKLLPAKIEWNQPADKTIFEFTRSFFEQRYELPSAQTVEDYLTVRKDQEGLERLKDLEKQNPYVRTNYAHLVANTVTEQNSIRAVSALKQAQEIITKGLIIDDTKLHGLRDGIKHFSSLAPTFVTNEYAAKTTGNLRQDGNEVWTDYLISKANRAIAWGKFCGLNAIDSVVRGIKKGELWIHAASTGEGKCLAGDALVFDHSTHRMRTVKEMFDSGSKPIVDSLEDEGFTGSTRLIQAQTEAIVANGEKQVWDLTLESGKRIGATSNHGFYTLEGWKSLGDLKPGDFIATQKELQSSGFDSYTQAEVKVAGYLTGDGGIIDCISFTQDSDVIRQDFISALSEMGLVPGSADYEVANYQEVFPGDRTAFVRVSHGLGDRWHRVTPSHTDRASLRELEQEKSFHKFVPSEFFGLSDDLVSAYLGALWSTDGNCSFGDYDRKNRPLKSGEIGSQTHESITYASTSRTLCEGVQLLLLRLGIQSTVTKKDTFLPDGKPYTSWVTRIVGTPSKRTFCERIQVVGKQDKFAQLLARLPAEDRTAIPSTLLPDKGRVMVNGYWRYANQHKKSPTVSQHVASLFGVGTGDIRWDRVSDITFRGVEMTYDLSVPRHHSFVANGIVTHNTTFALNWCYNLVTRYKSNVLYVSLEMPYKQLRDKIYAIHSTHPKFAHYGKGLDYEKIKYGLLDPTEERWFQEVANDFGGSVVEVKSADDLQPNPLNSSDYGSFHVVSPEDDVNMDDIRAMAELKHQEEEIHMVVIDHGLLVEARKKKRNKDTTSEMNSVLRDAKQRLALQFNHGEGMAVLVLFQINREGKAYADKNEGRYRLSALAQANETERSADIVTTSYLNDEHRAAGTMFFDNLKRRDGAHFPPFTAAIYWPSGRLGNLDPFTSGTAATGKGMSIEDMRNVDAILSEL